MPPMLIHDLVDTLAKGLAITAFAIAALYIAGALH
jgi:hypothetical protein